VFQDKKVSFHDTTKDPRFNVSPWFSCSQYWTTF